MKKLIAAATLLLFALPGMAFAQILSVKGPKANFRKGPSVKNEILYTADKNYPVKVLKRQKGWIRVEDFQGDKGWVLEKAPFQGESPGSQEREGQHPGEILHQIENHLHRRPGSGFQGDQDFRKMGSGSTFRRGPWLDPSLAHLGALILPPLIIHPLFKIGAGAQTGAVFFKPEPSYPQGLRSGRGDF